MAYTDFANVADPSFWDGAESGFLDIGWYTVSTTDLVAIKGERTGTLASLWSGTRYEPYGQPVLFQFPTAIELSELWVDVLDDQGYAGMWVFGPDNSVLFGGPRPSYDNDSIDITDEFGSLISRIYHFTFPAPAAVKAILLDDFNNYPQGRPGLLYGIYGSVLAGDPPPPPPFWTNLLRASELGA